MYTVFQFNKMAVMVICLTVALAVGRVDGTSVPNDGTTRTAGFLHYSQCFREVDKQGLEDSCYGSLGCFSNGYPWTSLLRPVPAPKSPDFLDTRYYIYTRNAPNRFVVSHPFDGVYDLDGSDFDSSRPTIFIVHGFQGNGSEDLTLGLKDAAIAKSDANVIIVDWAKGSWDGTYFNAVSNTRVVAATTIQLLNYLKNTKGVNVAKVHFIGFSLGAHISGYVGKAFNPKIGRITALDAAQPFFETYDKAVRLDVTDAVYIDAIHTDARPFIPTFGYGCVNPVGHSDFYVNGGWNQPGCQLVVPPFTNLIDFGNAAISSLEWSLLKCPHFRAVELFVSSATLPDCRFWGHKINAAQRDAILSSGGSLSWTDVPCNGATCSEMGFDSIHYPARGSFDVKTSTTSPYCLSDPTSNSAMASSYIP